MLAQDFESVIRKHEERANELQEALEAKQAEVDEQKRLVEVSFNHRLLLLMRTSTLANCSAAKATREDSQVIIPFCLLTTF